MRQSFTPRWINAVLGLWLFVSAFLWGHSIEQFYNTWVVGLAVLIAAAIAVRFERFRYVNMVLAVWLLVSAWALPTLSEGTFWNNLIVSALMFVTAMVRLPAQERTLHQPPSQRPAGAQ